MRSISYDDKLESKNIIRLRNTVGIVRAMSLCSPFYCRALWFGGTWHSLNWFYFPLVLSSYEFPSRIRQQYKYYCTLQALPSDLLYRDICDGVRIAE